VELIQVKAERDQFLAALRELKAAVQAAGKTMCSIAPLNLTPYQSKSRNIGTLLHYSPKKSL
jgi:hypothetical protein